MERLTAAEYARRMGKSQQAVNYAIKMDWRKSLKGVTKIETLQSGKRNYHILYFNPDYENEN